MFPRTDLLTEGNAVPTVFTQVTNSESCDRNADEVTYKVRIPLSLSFIVSQHEGVWQNGRLAPSVLTFRHRASSILGKAFRYSPENAFYIFNQQIYFII